ncbi:MAG: methyltransferase family protein [Promethearchaeota archaeon]
MQIVFFFGATILLILLNFVFPIYKIILPPYSFIGILILGIGLTIILWTVVTMKKSHTTIEFYDIPSSLVITGPFSISRNPMYIGGVILLISISVFLGSLISFIFPPLVFLILHFYYLPIEEEKMQNLFGNEYIQYKNNVRRWI